jgi:hypothetical protein
MHTKNKNELEFTVFNIDVKVVTFYKFLYQINDIILAMIFITGSFLFLMSQLLLQELFYL